VLLQVARLVEREEDEAADAFVFVCERLAANQFARLRRFDPAGPANPLTWLRVVARNLCLDHQRSIRGRFRVFESIARLPVVDQLVFRRRYRDRLTLAETFAVLGPEMPGLTLEAVVAADQRVGATLSSRQIWSLSVARPSVESLTAVDEADARAPFEPASTDPNPEALFASAEHRERLRSAIGALSHDDRLIVRLRLEQDLTLAEVARVCGLRDAQHADRRLRAIYQALRRTLE
jgi:RNA polymerase sigma factor (sigma-70 family)